MDPSTESAAAGSTGALSDKDAQSLVLLIGRIINAFSLYGMDHRIATAALEEGFESLNGLLARAPSIRVVVSEDALLVGGQTVDAGMPLLAAVRDRLKEAGASNFWIKNGMTADEFIRFFLLLTDRERVKAESGGFNEALAQSGMTHIEARTVVLREVGEDEVLVPKGEAEAGRRAIADESVMAEQVTNLLRAEGTAFVAQALDARLVAACADRIADLIVSAAQSPAVERLPPAEREARYASLTENVRRVFDALCTEEATSTQKGRKQVAKTLAALQETLHAKLAGGGVPADGEEVAALDAACDEMADELRTDDLVSQFEKRRAAVEDSERRLLRYVKTKAAHHVSAEALGSKLRGAGLSSAAWEGLLIKSGGAPSGAAGAEGTPPPGSAKKLGALVDDMVWQVDLAKGAVAETEAMHAVDRVGNEVARMLAQAEQRMDKFTEMAARADQDDKAEGAPGMSRRALIQFLAELVQEIKQPASVVTCTLEMLSTGRLTEKPALMQQMLGLATESQKRIDTLIGRLAQISGLPSGFVPDKKIISAMY